MHFNSRFIFPLCVFALGTHTNSFAWWDQAHQLVGRIASETVTPRTHERVTTLLRVPIAIPGSEELSQNTSTFDTAASWADSIKMYSNQLSDTSISSCHYLDLEMNKKMIGDSVSDSDAKKALDKALAKHTVNSVKCLKSAIKTLLDHAQTTEDEAIAVRFVIHLVGDIAQPLHSVGFVENGVSDDGGNKTVFPMTIYIPTTNGHGSAQTKLHAVWDGTLGAFLQFPYNREEMKKGVFTESDLQMNAYYARSLQTAQFAQDLLNDTLTSEPSVEKWVMDSYKVAVKESYTDLTMPWGIYSVPRQQIVTTQIVKGSYQLALLLDALFDPTNASPAFQTMIYSIKNDRSVKPFVLR